MKTTRGKEDEVEGDEMQARKANSISFLQTNVACS